MKLLSILCLAVLAPFGDDIFVVKTKGSKTVVSANSKGVDADHALRELARVLGWQYKPATESVVDGLADTSLDLAFSEQQPRVVAQLIAVSAGMDVEFDDRTTTSMHVSLAQIGATQAGRQRLRKEALHWYRTFLTAEADPLVEQEGMRVFMEVGKLRLEQGDLDGAIKAFANVHSEGIGSTPFWTVALLKMAEANYELGKLAKAEKYARELTEQHPSLKPTAQATVLLGRILLASRKSDGSDRYDEAVQTMESSYLRLAGAPEIIDIYLLVAEAQMYRNRPDKVVRALDILAGSKPTSKWSRKQWLDYHYLRGLGAEGQAAQPAKLLETKEQRKERELLFEEARQSLELFLGQGKDDLRRGQAFVVLGRAYLRLHRYLEARAAALEGMAHRSRMSKDWIQAARIMEAKTALVLGDAESAFMNLETEVRKPGEQKPKLILFLVDALTESGQFQRAITNAELLAEKDGEWGDQARYRQVLAMWMSSRDAKMFKGFPEKATRIAKRIKSTELQRQVAELIGAAYEELNMVQEAADAYRGMLR